MQKAKDKPVRDQSSSQIADANEIPLTDEERTGNLIRSRRKIRRMSLQEMADEVGVSTGLLSQVERGLSSPSLQTLKKICEALEMPFSWLFSESVAHADSDIVVRATDRRRLVFSSIGMVKELLNQDAPSAIQMVIMTISPNGSSGEKAIVGEGEKAGLVLRGSVSLAFEDRVVTLDAGDSFRFRNDIPHWWRNPSTTEVEIIMTVTPPFY